MFWAVEYELESVLYRVALDVRSHREVPVRTRGSSCKLFALGGGHAYEEDESPGRWMSWPPGDVVNLQTLGKPTGLWQRLRDQITPVKIAVSRFYYIDASKGQRIVDLKPGQSLQGALVTRPLDKRVYFVVVAAPITNVLMPDRWPRVVTSHGAAQTQ